MREYEGTEVVVDEVVVLDQIEVLLLQFAPCIDVLGRPGAHRRYSRVSASLVARVENRTNALASNAGCACAPRVRSAATASSDRCPSDSIQPGIPSPRMSPSSTHDSTATRSVLASMQEVRGANLSLAPQVTDIIRNHESMVQGQYSSKFSNGNSMRVPHTSSDLGL
jgi:hypothetical protein